jgi:hypothetical protein
MRRRHFILGAGAATAFASPSQAQPGLLRLFEMAEDDFGADLTGDDFRGVQRALHPDMVRGTSMEVTNAAHPRATAVVLDNLPTVSSQGTPTKLGNPGTCEAQSFGYCLGAYTAARLPNGQRKWSAADANNQPSAGWLYQWVHSIQTDRQCPQGSKAVPYAQKLVTSGAPSSARFPYNPDDASTVQGICQELERIDISNPGPDAARLRIGSYKAYSGVLGKKEQYLETFKSLIRNGHAIAFSGYVPKGYGKPTLTNGVFTAPDGFTKPSGHGQVIVGFDDSRGEHGAFLVQNSFSPLWNAGPRDDPGYNGRIWYGYNAWFKGQSLALVAYPNDPGAPSGQRLTSNTPGAPQVFLKESRRYQEGGASYLALILHGADAFQLNQITVTGPHGLASTEQLNETIRFGYAYVERKPPFQPGRYHAQLTGQYDGRPASWEGVIDVA